MSMTPGQFIERAQGIHDAIADDLAPFGGLLRCTTCKREQPLGDVAGNLRDGWPKCCGYTMTWMTQRLLDEEAAAGR
jgi:hypothetical protein